MNLETLKESLRALNFEDNNSIRREQLRKIVVFTTFKASRQEIMLDWEQTISTSANELNMVDWNLQRPLMLPMDELNYVLSRLVELVNREKNKVNYLLKEDLM